MYVLEAYSPLIDKFYVTGIFYGVSIYSDKTTGWLVT